jgi:aldose 1-epimerase
LKATSLEPTPFGLLADGRTAACFILQNAHLRVRVTDYGARLVSIETPDRHGVWGHVLLGFDNARTYAEAGGSFGAILGRYANRIDRGQFTLDGQHYQLAVNSDGNTLHGGPEGFGLVLWQVKSYQSDAGELVLSYASPDGDQGFPGTLSVEAAYSLTANRIQIILKAVVNRATIVNLSSHPYFNLGGAAAGDCLSHEICIAADRFLVTDHRQIPTGEQRTVHGSPFDFQKPKRLAADIRKKNEQILIARGYDHCFVTASEASAHERFVASAYEHRSGRMLKLFTNQPGLQFYSGNSLNGSVAGWEGVIFRQAAGFAFEAQDFPDAPNHLDFPSTVLRPGEVYRRTISYEFSIE